MPRTSHSVENEHKLAKSRSVARATATKLMTPAPDPAFLSSPSHVIHLQSAIGNQQVQRMLHHQSAISHAPAGAVQRDNMSDFQAFASNQWRGFQGNVGAIGNAIDPRPAYQQHANRGGWHNMRRGMGVGAAQLGLGLPLGIAAGALSGLGRGLAVLGAGGYYTGKAIGSGLSNVGKTVRSGLMGAKKKAWDPLTGHQQAQTIGNAGMGTAAGVSAVGSSMSSMFQGNMALPEGLRTNADISLIKGGKALENVSEVGQGFNAAGGIATGIGGVINMGSGLGNLFGSNRTAQQRATRGFGRFMLGGAQAFAGTAAAGKAIGTMQGVASPAASTLASALIPAQAALSGIDIIRGSYLLNKARKRKAALGEAQTDFEAMAQTEGNENMLGPENAYYQQLAAQAQMAKEYQNKRMRNAGLTTAAGVLGAVGAGLTLSGVGAIAGVPLMITAGLLKAGTSLGPIIRDKLNSDKARQKVDKEYEWARFMAKHYTDEGVKRILRGMSAEGNALDDEKLSSMTFEERTEVMKKQLMKR